MEVVAFSMAGAPRGKGRPRLTTRGGFAHAYTDPKTRDYEASIAKIARKAMGDAQPFQGPLSVALRFRIPLPKSMSKRERAAILAGEQFYFGAVDCDNAAKSVLDACNGVCFLDDKQVTRLFVLKDPAANPGVDVRIEPLCEVA